jgi:hypothetical protein
MKAPINNNKAAHIAEHACERGSGGIVSLFHSARKHRA